MDTHIDSAAARHVPSRSNSAEPAVARRARHGRPVIRVLARHDDLAFRLVHQVPVAPDHAQHRVDRLRTGTGIEDPVELGLRQLTQHDRKFDRRRMSTLEETVVVRQLAHLVGRRIDELVAAVAGIHAP